MFFLLFAGAGRSGPGGGTGSPVVGGVGGVGGSDEGAELGQCGLLAINGAHGTARRGMRRFHVFSSTACKLGLLQGRQANPYNCI